MIVKRNMPILTLTALMVGAGLSARAAVASWDFGSGPGKDNLDDFSAWTTSTDNESWAYTPDTVFMERADGGERERFGVTTEVSDLSSGDFEITWQARSNDNWDVDWNHLGGTFLGTANDQPGFGIAIDSRQDEPVNNPDNEGVVLRLFDASDSDFSTIMLVPFDEANPKNVHSDYLVDKDWEFIIEGTQLAGNHWQLDATVNEVGGPESVSLQYDTTTGTVYNGDYVGLYARLSNLSDIPPQAQFYSLDVIPEPTTFGLLLLGLLGAIPRRLRRS